MAMTSPFLSVRIRHCKSAGRKAPTSEAITTCRRRRRLSSTATAFSDEDDASVTSADAVEQQQHLQQQPSRSSSGTTRCLRSCLADGATRSGSRVPKSVSFGRVELRQYPVVLCDNPCPSSGPPVGLGWSYDEQEILEADIDTYEAYCCGGGRRTKEDFRIPAEVRVSMLIESGHGPGEIAAAICSVRRERERRIASLRRKRYDLVAEGAEWARRGVMRIMMASTTTAAAAPTPGGSARRQRRRDSLELAR